MDRYRDVRQQVLRDTQHRSACQTRAQTTQSPPLSELCSDPSGFDDGTIRAKNGGLHGWEHRSIRLAIETVEAGRKCHQPSARPRHHFLAAEEGGLCHRSLRKWHLGEKGDYHPGKRGFDEAIVSDGKHFDFETNPKMDIPKGTYLADFLTDKAVDFMVRHKDQPFFLYLPHFGVHSPHQAKEDWIAKFKGKTPVGGHNSPTYAAMIASVDESVGRVLKTLDDLKLTDNTIVIFTSDNGGVGGYGRPDGLMRDLGSEEKKKAKKGEDEDGGGITDNAPLRSGKGSLYEGGTREPFIVRWPGVTQPETTCDVPTIHVDIYPTLLELCSASLPNHVLDGESLVKLFQNPKASLKRDAIFQHFPGYLGSGPGLWRTKPVSLIQMGDWKLMEYLEDGRLELYHLRSDLGETKNLAEAMPEKTKVLHDRLIAWRKEVHAPMPTKNVPSVPANKTPKAKKNQASNP